MSSIEPESHPLLAGARPETRALILEAPVRHFVDHEHLLHDEGVPKALYAIVEGRVRIERRGVKITERRAGEVVGEQAFIDRRPHSADVIADGDVRAIEIVAERMEQVLLDPTVARTLLSTLSCKLRESTDGRYKKYAERDRLFAFSGQFVAPIHRDRMLEEGENFGLPHLARGVIVMFTDARDFTATSADLDPMLLGRQIGEYVAAIGDVLRAHGAFVDKFIGDGTMAFWGYPGMPQPNAAVALEAAKQIVALPLQLGDRLVRTGVGIHVGDAFMGNVGSDERRQFTILGNVVNLAARFEGLTKVLDADVVCSVPFYELLGDKDREGFVLRPGIDVRGVSEPMNLYAHNARPSDSATFRIS